MAAVVKHESLVFVDECGVHTSLAPLYGYAPKGERLRLGVPRKRGKNTMVLSSITLSGVWDLPWPWKERPPLGYSRPT